ncbi:PREDICTED: uncharacterized protein LOC108761504 [Trachymyrmex cornetzi]|uniref:uncharacterized protein LOC108761504 n=1 Tax=Trachymyrmex cornetzi TaxID=471704 RepID=UPI00084F29F1|nr:PREDICTED: uncharacterized protein LOC108761504 [Trachymyrmex cornetzi]
MIRGCASAGVSIRVALRATPSRFSAELHCFIGKLVGSTRTRHSVVGFITITNQRNRVLQQIALSSKSSNQRLCVARDHQDFNLDCLFSPSSPPLISSFPFGLPYVEIYPATHQAKKTRPIDLGSSDTIDRATTNDLFRASRRRRIISSARIIATTKN